MIIQKKVVLLQPLSRIEMRIVDALSHADEKAETKIKIEKRYGKEK